jgi:hypothetical protein
MLTHKHIRALTAIAFMGFAVPASAQTCAALMKRGPEQVLKNNCSHAITLVHCGVGPTGNSTLDCNRNKLAMGGVRPGGIVTVTDQFGSYSRIYWMECPGGATPSRQRWTGNEIVGECPR